MVHTFRFLCLTLVFLVAPSALAQIDFMSGERLVSVGAFTQGGDVAASGVEAEAMVSSRFALSLAVETSGTLRERPWSVQGPLDENGPAIRTFMVGARGLVGRQGVNSPATLSLGVNAGVAAFQGGDESALPIVEVTAQTTRVLSFPGDRFFVAPSGRFGLTTILDSRVAATTAAFGGAFGFGFHATPELLFAVTPNLTVAHGPGSGAVVAFAATFGVAFSY